MCFVYSGRRLGAYLLVYALLLSVAYALERLSDEQAFSLICTFYFTVAEIVNYAVVQ